MINTDHAKRVLEQETPQLIMAQVLAKSLYPSPKHMATALEQIEALVKKRYAIEPIEDDDEN